MILRVTGFQFLSLHAAYKIQETASLTLPGINTIVNHCSIAICRQCVTTIKSI